MKIHILPGESLVERFKETNLEGEIAVCRECLIDGDVTSENLEDFWQVRENYLNTAYPKPSGFYRREVRSEFEKLLNLPEGTEVNFWFEHELFCQVNMWFCLWLLGDKKFDFYRVAPIFKSQNDIWKGFGILDKSGLEKCFARRTKFGPQEIRLGKQLWQAFSVKDFEALQVLGQKRSECFPYLREVCRAEIQKEIRPKATLQRIMAEDQTEFGQVFQKFNEIEGIYGFGDLQVKRIYDEII